MDPLLRKLALHLLAATSVPLAVAAALAGLWMLPAWLTLPVFARALIRAAVPVLAAVTIAMYVLHFVATVSTYLRGHTSPPGHGIPNPPPALDRVIPNLWRGVGSTFILFFLFLGLGLLLGAPARSAHADRLTYGGFLWLERGTLFSSAAVLVFSLALMSTHALRGIERSFYYALNGVRRTELWLNLPFAVAVAALPLFVALLVVELR